MTDISNSNQQTIITLLQQIQARLDDIEAAKASAKPARKASKPRDPNAPPKPPTSWTVFVAEVRDALVKAGITANAMAYASHLKNTFDDAYSWDAEAIVAEYSNWTPPPSKAKAKEDSAEDKPKKPRKPMTDEHKAKLAAGKKAAAAARKAAEYATQDDASPPSPKAVSPPAAPAPAPAPAAADNLKPFPFKGKKLLLDPATSGTWLRVENNGVPSKGAWYGTLSADRKSIDTEAADPTA